MLEKILTTARTIYAKLGPGRREGVYQTALRELCARDHNLRFQSEYTYPILLDALQVGVARLDLYIPGVLVIECKAIANVGPKEKAQCAAYHRDLRVPVLLLNFGIKDFTHEVVGEMEVPRLLDIDREVYGC